MPALKFLGSLCHTVESASEATGLLSLDVTVADHTPRELTRNGNKVAINLIKCNTNEITLDLCKIAEY